MWGPRSGGRRRSLAAGIPEEVAEVPPVQQGSQHLHACTTQVHRAAWCLGGLEGPRAPNSGTQILAGYHLSPEGPAVTPTPSKKSHCQPPQWWERLPGGSWKTHGVPQAPTPRRTL